jgi:gas vesicle protein
MNYNETTRNLRGASTNLTYLLIGGGIGATLALLFAPKAGVDLRQDISEGAKLGLETANEKVTQFREVAGEKVSALRDTATDYYGKAQEKVSELYSVATKTANDGTTEAKELAGKAVNSAKELLDGGTEPQQVNKETPHFDSGDKRPTEQRSAKAGVI